MGKGLSTLQKKILLLAYKNENSNVCAHEILISVYGFPPLRKGKLIFNRRYIGLKRYNASTVAVCKSMNRLSERGFVNRVPLEGIYLTRKGARAAEGLKMEERTLFPKKSLTRYL